MKSTISQRLTVKKSLSTDGDRILKLLVNEYHMQHMDAVKLMMDGGPMLAVVLIKLTQG
jgi:hypothetical protein